MSARGTRLLSPGKAGVRTSAWGARADRPQQVPRRSPRDCSVSRRLSHNPSRGRETVCKGGFRKRPSHPSRPPAIRREVVAHACSRVPFRERTAAFPKRLYATAYAQSDSASERYAGTQSRGVSQVAAQSRPAALASAAIIPAGPGRPRPVGVQLAISDAHAVLKRRSRKCSAAPGSAAPFIS